MFQITEYRKILYTDVRSILFDTEKNITVAILHAYIYI